MLGYICKYAPIEIFESMGVQMHRIESEVSNFNQADLRMHPNVCSFAKGVLEEVMTEGYEGVILTTCCDSIRRLYDVLKEQLPDRFIYMLDTPRITKDAGIRLYENRIRQMVREYQQFSGKCFDEERFLSLLKERKAEKEKSERERNGAGSGLSVGIAGARANQNIKKILEEKGAAVVFDLTCTGLDRKILVEEDQVMTGGVAKNPGVVRAVEEKIGSRLYICPEPEIVGAAGAAIYALEAEE